jgi:hypothetical protein
MPHCLVGQADTPVCGSSVSTTRLAKGQRSLQEVARNSRIDASSNRNSGGGAMHRVRYASTMGSQTNQGVRLKFLACEDINLRRISQIGDIEVCRSAYTQMVSSRS